MKMHDVQRPPTRPQRYQVPTSVEDAVALLAQAGDSARLIAGGSDLLVELDRGAHESTELLIDISRVPGLDRIDSTDDGGLRLGAAVTHNQVVADERCRAIALPLAQACLEVGSPQLRNRATVVGNIVTASPANDTIGPLMVLGATVEIVGPLGTRTQPVAEFITGFRKTSLGRGEIVTGLVIPGPVSNTRSMFVKAGLRRAQAISVANATVLVQFEDDGSTVGSATAALGSVAPTVIEVRLDQYLAGTSLDADSIDLAARAAAQAASPIDDLRSTAEYRLRMVEVMVRRALHTMATSQHASTWPRRTPMLWSEDFTGRFAPPAGALGPIADGDRIEFTLNGREVAVAAQPGSTLLDFLRDSCDAKGVKEGCAEGECGACTVHLDGAAVMSCLVPSARAAGADVTTVEGLGTPQELHPVQASFASCGAAQCGFCTPGLLMSASMLIGEFDELDRNDIQAGLAGNLCRCTGYGAIEAAVALAAASQPMQSGEAR